MNTTHRIRLTGIVRDHVGNWIRASVAPSIRATAQALRLVRKDRRSG